MAQTATILVTDLAGSTETRVQLGEERAEELRRAHDLLLAEQASAHGGNVIKGMGDGLIVAFAGTAEALTSAVAMQQALDRYGRREGIALSMRVGVSAGDVTFENDDCFGTPVIEAARLCAMADPGQILVADLVRLLARGRSEVQLLPCGPMTLKGLPEPLDVWSVQWEPVVQSPGLRAKTPYVGRERERETLADCWRSATAGSGGLVLIAGEPGIGKTRLVTELSEHVVRPAGGVVLIGGCHDGDVVANAPFVEAFTDWVRHTPAGDVAAVLGAEAAVLARMVPAITDALPDTREPLPVPRDAEIARLHDAVGQVFLRLGEDAPVLLVIDDLHWADDATVGMLRALSRAARRGAMLLIGTYRETDVDRRHPFAQALAVMTREVEPTRVTLSGLETADVHAMLERIAEHAVPEELASMLTTETEGNPFFLRETLLHLWEEGELRFEDGVWTLAGALTDLGLPAGIRDVIGRRLSRLSEATNRLLTAGALFEVAFPLPVAADVAGVDENEALDAIDAALEARIVRATDTFDNYSFTHALFRHALVEELNPSRQVRMHRAIATALEKQLRGLPTPAQAAALARHYHRSAALPNAEQGVPFALIAADDAARHYARREEYDALDVALELLSEGDEREPELLRRRAETAVYANVGAERVLESASAAGELTRLLEGDDAACDFVAGLASECAMLDDIRLAWDVAAVARRWLRPDRRDETYVQLRSFELAQREFDDPEHPGIPLDTPERRELLELTRLLPQMSGATLFSPFIESRAEAQHAYEMALPGDSSWSLLGPLWLLGAHREMRDLLRGRIDELLARGVIASTVFDLALLARVQNVLGEYDGAQASLDQGFALLPRIAETSNPALQLFAAFLLQRSVRGELIPSTELAGFAPFGDSPDVRWAWVAVTAFRGSLLAQEGNADEAIAVLHEIMPVIERAGGWAQNYPTLTYSAAYALWYLQRTDELEVIERNLRAKVVEPDIRYPECDGRTALALLCGLDRRIDEARNWFDEARRVLEEQGSEPLLVAVDYEEAVMNHRLGTPDDLARARVLLDRARARCTHPALAPWLARIDDLSARCLS
jgi:class 3 adenylate cyclase